MIEENDEESENSVGPSNRSEKTVIKPRTTCIWLNKVGYQYTNIKKSVCFDGYERLDIVEYQAQFLKKLEALGLYLREIYNDNSIERKDIFQIV